MTVDTPPSRRTSLRIAVLVFLFIFLLVSSFVHMVDQVTRHALPSSIVIGIKVVPAVIIAFFISRWFFLSLRAGRITYLLRPRVLHNLRQSVKHGSWGGRHIIASILLGLAVLAWARSYWRADLLSIPLSKMICVRLVSCSGIVMSEYLNRPNQESRFTVKSYDSERIERSYESWALKVATVTGKKCVGEEDYGFYAFRAKTWSLSVNGITYRISSLNLPYWLFALLFAILPCLAIGGGFVRYRRCQTPVCQTCGYNLTGNVSGVCPECGTKIGTSSTC